tara:strand:+ start:4305 stop:5192 length:888 start_codon:yes stop_codon:yes gene_type:complete
MMDFLTELHEARMTRDSGNQRVLTYTDCCERLYLTMLTLELLRRYPQFAPVAHGYAKKTTDRDSYKHFRMYATDLYNFAYFVQGDTTALEKLKDPKAALAMRTRTTLPAMAFNRYLIALSSGRTSTINDQKVFLDIESALRIVNTDYKAVRRNIFNLNRLATADKKKTVTRLLYAVRAKLRSSDIIEHLEALAAVRDLETAKVRDPEPTVSIADISVTAKDLGFYRYLLGTKNLMLAKKFIELAKDGKPIPPQMVRAYMPAIKSIDNIVKAGPAFISMLKALERRALQSQTSKKD